MERLSTPTGGRALFTDSIDELHTAFAELLDELSNQYLIGYQSSNSKRDDPWRKIKVDVDGQHDVRARQGYRALAGKVNATTKINAEIAMKHAEESLRFRACVFASSWLHFVRSRSRSATATAAAVLPILRRSHLARRHGRRRQRQAVPELTPADFNVRIDGNPRRVVTAEWVPLATPTDDTDGTAAAGRIQHERQLHRRPADRHRDRSAEHPVRWRDGDQQGGQRVHRSSGAVGSRGGCRLWHRRAGDGVHRRPRAHQAGDQRGWSGRSRRPASIDVGHNIALVEAQAIDHGDRAMLERCSSANAPPCGTRRRARRCAASRSRWKRTRWRMTRPRRRSDDPDPARSVHRPAPDRRAEDADPDL